MADSLSDLRSPAPRRWPLFLLGVLLFVFGPVLYAAQLGMSVFTVPWYVPILATVGACLMALSAWRRPGILRGVGLALFVLLCGVEWFFLSVGTRTPPYAGPAQAGQKIPEFTTRLADGSAFTNHDLENGNPTVLLFFRGRW